MGLFAWFKKQRERRKRWSELPQPALPAKPLPLDPYGMASSDAPPSQNNAYVADASATNTPKNSIT
jgi:hypothetical protein